MCEWYRFIKKETYAYTYTCTYASTHMRIYVDADVHTYIHTFTHLNDPICLRGPPDMLGGPELRGVWESDDEEQEEEEEEVKDDDEEEDEEEELKAWPNSEDECWNNGVGREA